MMMKKAFCFVWVVVFAMLLAGCGPTLLSDEEFAATAQETCQILKTSIATLDQLDFANRAEAYRLAAGTLAELNISEESAPQGTLLQTSLSGLADAYENFAAALEKALAGADMNTPARLMVTEDGNVYATSGSIFEAVKLDIDNALVLDMNSQMAAVQESATALGLEECVLEQQGDE